MLDTMAGLRASFAGLQAQRARMNIIASNLANAEVTRTPEGGPYQRKEVIFAALPQAASFEDLLQGHLKDGVSEVRVVDIASAPNDLRLVYDPEHPDANTQGYVAYPNINVLQEMADLVATSRLYEANVTAVNATKDMMLRALQIGRV